MAPAFESVLERVFELKTGRKTTEVVARFATPVPDRRDVACTLQIDGLPDEPIRRTAFGVDGVQSLWLAMELAAIELLASRAYRAGRLTFLGSYDLQLPLRDTSRILARWDLEAERLARAIRTGANGDGGELRAALEEAAARARAPARPSAAPVLVERELEFTQGAQVDEGRRAVPQAHPASTRLPLRADDRGLRRAAPEERHAGPRRRRRAPQRHEARDGAPAAVGRVPAGPADLAGHARPRAPGRRSDRAARASGPAGPRRPVDRSARDGQGRSRRRRSCGE